MGKKQPNGYFKRQTNEILDEKNWTLLRKENSKRQTESLLIATENNSMRTNYVKTKID